MEIGIVQQVVDKKEDFNDIIKEICQKLQQTAPGALKSTKDIMTKTVNGTISNSLLEYLVEEYVRSRKGAEAEGAMKALAEKKKPSWMDAAILPRALLY